MQAGKRGQAEHDVAIAFHERANLSVRGKKIGRHAAPGIELQLRANVARGGDHLLQKRDLAIGRGVAPLRERLGKTLERYGHGAGALRPAMPKLLGEKRHERMEQAKCRIKNREKISPRGDGYFAVRGVRRSVRNGRLDPFHVPVAKVPPKEVVDGMRRFVETVMRERIVDDLDVMCQARKNPAVASDIWPAVA